MISSRDINDLHPVVKPKVEAFLQSCKDAGIDLLVTSTYRDNEAQDALYAQGRRTGGLIVTKAKGGESYHNYRCAVDVVPLVNGKCVWDTLNPIWRDVSRLGKAAGLEWAGDWARFTECPHFQYTGGLSLADLKAGRQVV